MNVKLSDIGQTLIIGVSGFIGRHIARHCNAEGTKLVGLSNRRPEGINFDDFHHGRSETTGLLAQALEGCENVVYLGGTSRPALGMERITDEITRESNHVIDVAQICADLGVKRFIFASSGGTVYGVSPSRPVHENQETRPINLYGLSKVVAEHGIRLVGERAGMSAISLRISNPFGPGQVMRSGQGFIAACFAAAKTGVPLKIWGDGTVIRDFIYINDVAKAVMSALQSDIHSHAINIGAGKGVSLNDICPLVAEVTGRKIRLEFEASRKVDVPKIVLSIEKAGRLLSWKPTTTLSQGLQATSSWWESKNFEDPIKE